MFYVQNIETIVRRTVLERSQSATCVVQKWFTPHGAELDPIFLVPTFCS